MGNKVSRLNGDRPGDDENHGPNTSKRDFFTKRVLAQSTSNLLSDIHMIPKRAATYDGHSRKRATTLHGRGGIQALKEDSASPDIPALHRQKHSSSPDAARALTIDGSDPETLTESIFNNHSSQSHNLPPGQYDDDQQSITTVVTHHREPSTPEISPVLLPPPSPLLEESPSKYGITRPRSADDRRDEEKSEMQRTMHLRGKSSTALDIFKASSALHTAQTHLNTFKPPALPSSPNSSVTLQCDKSQNPPLHPANRALQLQPDPNRPVHYHIETFRPGICTLLKQPRPETCNAPGLTRVQDECYHEHKQFRPSKNAYHPVACMLCYVDDVDAERWTCAWCALRVCTKCRAKVERLMRREKRSKGSPQPTTGKRVATQKLGDAADEGVQFGAVMVVDGHAN